VRNWRGGVQTSGQRKQQGSGAGKAGQMGHGWRAGCGTAGTRRA